MQITTAWVRVSSALSCISLALVLSGCHSKGLGECAPHEEGRAVSPDGGHIAQTWVSICGFPGATVADIVSVAPQSITGPPRFGNFAFFEEQSSTSRDQIKVSWLDSGRLRITIDTLGEVRESPAKIGDVVVVYDIGFEVDLRELESRKQFRINERQHWERLKTSAVWRYVEDSYDFDAYVIKHEQDFLDWARDKAGRKP